MIKLEKEFNGINSHESLAAFIAKYSLQKHESNSEFILTYTGIVNYNQITLSHNFNPSVMKDYGHEISIEVKNPLGEMVVKSSVCYVE